MRSRVVPVPTASGLCRRAAPQHTRSLRRALLLCSYSIAAPGFVGLRRGGQSCCQVPHGWPPASSLRCVPRGGLRLLCVKLVCVLCTYWSSAQQPQHLPFFVFDSACLGLSTMSCFFIMSVLPPVACPPPRRHARAWTCAGMRRYCQLQSKRCGCGDVEAGCTFPGGQLRAPSGPRSCGIAGDARDLCAASCCTHTPHMGQKYPQKAAGHSCQHGSF